MRAPLSMRASSGARSPLLQMAGQGDGAAVPLHLLDEIMMVGEGSDLRQVGHTEHLMARRQRLQLAAHNFGDAPADAGVNFVEHQATG